MAALDAAPDRRANDDLARMIAAGAVAVLGQLVDDLVVGRPDEVCELNFADWLHAIQTHADGAAHDAVLTQRGVNDTLVAKLVEQALRHPKYAAHLPDIFAQDNDVRVRAHRYAQSVVDRLDHVHLGHAVGSWRGRGAYG